MAPVSLEYRAASSAGVRQRPSVGNQVALARSQKTSHCASDMPSGRSAAKVTASTSACIDSAKVSGRTSTSVT